MCLGCHGRARADCLDVASHVGDNFLKVGGPSIESSLFYEIRDTFFYKLFVAASIVW